MLKVKEIFYSIQGEGHNAGKPAIFVRFSGCNLWSGREEDKIKSVCNFCDTNFVGGVGFTPQDLAKHVISMWPSEGTPFIIFTGGEPTLQLRNSLFQEFYDILRLSKSTCSFAIETNGTTDYEYEKPIWITVSPKTPDFIRRTGNELKLLYPLPNMHPDTIKNVDFKYKVLQPVHDKDYSENLKGAVKYCLEHPSWELSIQQHKIIGVR